MRARLKPWAGAIVLTALTIVLVVLDLVDQRFREWWLERPFTTSVLSGILVLLVTVLVVNRIITKRQLEDRSVAVAAQAAIVMKQATRAYQAVTNLGDGHGGAIEELRTYAVMLLIAAPLLIDAPLSRTFLEDAQRLAAELSHALSAHQPDSVTGTTPNVQADTSQTDANLADAVAQMRAASAPLLAILPPGQQAAITGSLAVVVNETGQSGAPTK